MYRNNAPYVCTSGIAITDFHLQFETYGDSGNPVIVINHALSSGPHVRSTSLNPEKGWWESHVGLDASVDTKKFFVICIANLGGNFGSSNATCKDFPSLSISDIANTQVMVLNALNINNVYGVIGNSIGGFISLMLALKLGSRLEKLISISSAAKAYENYKKIHQQQQDLIKQDPLWNNGNYTTNTFPGMLNARKLGLLSYIDLADLTAKFPEISQRERYLNYNAIKFCKTFDPMVYLKISEMVSSFDCDNEGLSLSNLAAKTTVISVTTDVLFLPQQQQDLYDKVIASGGKAAMITVDSEKGHDAFYTDDKIAVAIKDALACGE